MSSPRGRDVAGANPDVDDILGGFVDIAAAPPLLPARKRHSSLRRASAAGVPSFDEFGDLSPNAFEEPDVTDADADDFYTSSYHGHIDASGGRRSDDAEWGEHDELALDLSAARMRESDAFSLAEDDDNDHGARGARGGRRSVARGTADDEGDLAVAPLTSARPRQSYASAYTHKTQRLLDDLTPPLTALVGNQRFPFRRGYLEPSFGSRPRPRVGAASAFYHLLVLASDDRVIVDQVCDLPRSPPIHTLL